MSFHSSLGKSPFKAIYGRDPFTLLDYVPLTATTKTVDHILRNRHELLQELKQNLLKAQSAIRKYADGKRRDVQFQEGDLVLVKLQPYRQSSVAEHASQKLGARYFGRFKFSNVLGRWHIRLNYQLMHEFMMCSMSHY